MSHSSLPVSRRPKCFNTRPKSLESWPRQLFAWGSASSPCWTRHRWTDREDDVQAKNNHSVLKKRKEKDFCCEIEMNEVILNISILGHCWYYWKHRLWIWPEVGCVAYKNEKYGKMIGLTRRHTFFCILRVVCMYILSWLESTSESTMFPSFSLVKYVSISLSFLWEEGKGHQESKPPRWRNKSTKIPGRQDISCTTTWSRSRIWILESQFKKSIFFRQSYYCFIFVTY